MNELLKCLQEIDVAAIATKLISIPSESFRPRQEEEVAGVIAKMLRCEGIEVTMQEVAPGRPNVIGRIPGGNGRTLMLCGHIDTVPAYDMENAFAPYITDGVLHGRGACDMKGAVAAMIAAMIAVKRSGISLGGDLVFAGVVDEEEGGIGAEYLTDHGPICTAAIIGEPTDLQIALGHKGLEWIAVDVAGKKVHGGNQDSGINAVEMAAMFIDRICRAYRPVLNTRTHPILGKATINVGRIEGGDQPSTVPGECRILLDRRLMVGEMRELVYGELEDICRQLHEEDDRFSAKISDLMEGQTTKPHLPYCVEESEPVVQSLSRSVREAGMEVVYTSFPAWTDAGTLKAYSTCIPIVCGPGALRDAHSVRDSVAVKDLATAAQLYATAAVDFLNGENLP